MTKRRNRSKRTVKLAVVVATAHRGIFFGYATNTRGATVALKRARNCIYWPPAVHGFMGLAANGPNADSRVGPAADSEVRDVILVARASPKAVKAWEAEPWAK